MDEVIYVILMFVIFPVIFILDRNVFLMIDIIKYSLKIELLLTISIYGFDIWNNYKTSGDRTNTKGLIITIPILIYVMSTSMLVFGIIEFVRIYIL